MVDNKLKENILAYNQLVDSKSNPDTYSNSEYKSNNIAWWQIVLGSFSIGSV